MRSFVLLVFAVAAGVLMSLVVSLADPAAILVVAIAGLVVAPLLARAGQHRFDIFEPIVWANAALFVMFVIRPVAHWAYDSYLWRGYDIGQALGGGLAVAAAGTAAIQFGYVIPTGRSIAARLPSVSTEFGHLDAALTYSLGFAVVGIVATVAFPKVALNASAYLYYLPMLVIPGALLLLAIGLRTRSPMAMLVAVLAVSGGFLDFGISGERAWLLALVAPALVYGLYLRRGARPRLVTVLLLLLISFPFLSAARDLHYGDSLADLVGATGSATISAPETVREFVLGPDTEMLDGLSLEVQAIPRVLPYHPGNSLMSLIAQPIPRALWPDKPRQADDLLNEFFFGDVGYSVGNAGVAYSLFGGLFYDSGLLGVLLGGLACGFLLRISWEWYGRHAGSPVATLVLATMLPFVVILLRGNTQDTLSRALFVIVPLLVVGFISHAAARPRRTLVDNVGAPSLPALTSASQLTIMTEGSR